MDLPKLDQPTRYEGLYIYDFGEWCAVGYTADEIAVLLESDQYQGGKTYKIHRALPDGRMELRGVSAERFQLESGMFFPRNDLTASREDFEALRSAAKLEPPPCRAKLHLSDRGEGRAARYVVGLVFPAEYEDDVGRWLLGIDYSGGDVAEGGISHATQYNEESLTVLDRHQLWPSSTQSSRCPADVLAGVHRAVQR